MSGISSLTATPLVPHGQSAAPKAASLWGGDGPGAEDFADLINPLQHIPGVSSLYHAATGDTASAGVQMIGGAVLGGLPGLAMAAAGAIFSGITGKDPGETAIGLLEGAGSAGPQPASQVFAAAPHHTPLEADAGEALLSLALAQEAEMKQASMKKIELPTTHPTLLSSPDAAPFLDLGPIRNTTEQAKLTARDTRLLSDLQETARDMKA